MFGFNPKTHRVSPAFSKEFAAYIWSGVWRIWLKWTLVFMAAIFAMWLNSLFGFILYGKESSRPDYFYLKMIPASAFFVFLFALFCPFMAYAEMRYRRYKAEKKYFRLTGWVTLFCIFGIAYYAFCALLITFLDGILKPIIGY